MSIFDADRKKYGLPTSSGASSNSGSSSFFQQERERILNGQPTKFQEMKSREVDNQRFAARALSEKSKPVSNPKKKEKKKDEGFMDNLKGFLIGDKVLEGFHLRDKKKEDSDTTLNKIGKLKPNEKATETDRFIANAANSAAFGLPKEIAKKTGDKHTVDSFYNEREFGKGGGTDMIAQGLGYLAPGALAVKGARAAGLGAKAGTTGLAKALQLGKEGAIIGGALSGAEIGIREGLNPNDYNWKDNASHLGMGIGTGLIGDPLLHGIGKGIGKGVDVGLKKWIPDLPERIPTDNFNLTKPKVNPSTLPNKLEPINLDPAFNAKRYHNPEQPLNDFLGKGKKVEDSPVLQMAKKGQYTNRELPDFSNSKYSIGKPEGDIISTHYGIDVPKDLVETAPPQYWQKRYEDFVSHVKQNYDTNQLTKEGLDDLWTQFARYDEPVTLEQVVDLAYKGYKEPSNMNANDVWDKLGNRPPAANNAKKILGIDDSMFLKEKGQKIQPPTLPEPLPQATIKKTLYKPEPKVNEPVPNMGPVQTNVKTNLDLPEPKSNERSFFNTVGKQEKVSEELLQRINEFDKVYTPMSNQELVNYANRYVAKDIDKAYQFVKNARSFDPRHVTVGHRLIDEFNARGDHNRALDVIERLAEHGTKGGQYIQSFSIYGKLTAEGQLLRAQRVVNRINENIPNPEKQVKLDEKSIKDITHAADSIQRLTGQEDLTKNVINIMERMKKGNTATDDELETVRSFVADAKKFIGDTTPKPERVKVKTNDVRTRDKVVDFMAKQEEVAKQRMRERMNRANSIPVDMFYDLSVIGASKIAKGTVKFADFAEQMIKEFGEEIRPYMKQIWDKAAETFNLQSESMTSKRLTEVEKIVNKATKDKTLSPEDAQAIDLYLKDYLKLTGDAKLEASMQLQSVLQLLERPSFAQKLTTIQTIGQLLNPKTMVRNALGNELFYRVEQINKLVATPIDIAKSKLTGSDRIVTFRTNNQGQFWLNFMTGLKAGWRGVNPNGLTSMYDIGSPAFRSKWNPLTYFEKALGASIKSFDNAATMRAYNHTLGELATLRAINEGLKGQAKKEAIIRYIREADENLMGIAEKYSKYVTFQDSSKFAQILQGTKKGLNKLTTFGITDKFGAGEFILKYPKTPGNLIMRALEYSPVGLVRSAHMLKDIKKVKSFENEREFFLSLTRAIIGTGGFSMMGYVLADAGILTSAGNSNYRVASLERNAGKQSNSVNVTALQRFVKSGFNLKEAGTRENDTFVTYDWAQPVSLAIALGTGVNQSAKESGKLQLYDGVKSALNSGADTIINLSVLAGLNDFLNSSKGQWTDKFEGVGKGAAASFVPTLTNQFKQLSDNATRNTSSPDNLQDAMNKVRNKIPGLNHSLPQSYDTLGNKRTMYQDDSNNILNVFFNPSFVSKYKPSKEAKFVLDFINRTGNDTVAPKMAPKKLDGIPLTATQQEEMQRIMGEETKRRLEALVPQLENSNNDEKTRRNLEKILRIASEKAKKELRREMKQ